MDTYYFIYLRYGIVLTKKLILCTLNVKSFNTLNQSQVFNCYLSLTFM